MRLLGMLGAAYAKAHDPGGVARAVAGIDAVTDNSNRNGPRHPRDNGLAEIGVALADTGSTDGAQALASKMADDYYKVDVLGHVAFARCTGGRVGSDSPAKEAVSVASRLSPDDNPVGRTSSLIVAAASLAACDGPDAARRFLTDNLQGEAVDQALGRTVRELTAAGHVAVATALAPPPAPSDPEDLLQAAQRLQRAGDVQDARRLAVRASEAAVKGQPSAGEPGYVRPDLIPLLGKISSLLAELGAYNDALKAVRSVDPINRRQYYRRVLSQEAERHDGPAIDRTLPLAMKVILAPTPSPYMVRNELLEVALTLAHAGFRKQAQVPFQAAAAVPSPPSVPSGGWDLTRYAAVQAAMGDLPGALKTASAAGPLVAQRTDAQKNLTAMLAMMMGARSKEDLVSPKALAMRKQLAATVPTAHPGPQAAALAATATELASEGDVPGALQAEAGLEKAPGNDLDGPLGTALSAIAEAQIKSGQAEAALQTALRIRQDAARLVPLLKLVALVPGS
jgi:tetratricopeptide (TPR) repeat protein